MKGRKGGCSRCSCLSSVALRIKQCAQKLVPSVTVIPEPWFGRSSSARKVLLLISWKAPWPPIFGAPVARPAPTDRRRSPFPLKPGVTDLNHKRCCPIFLTFLQVGVAPPPAKRLPAVLPGPPPVHALARFDGQQIGAEYLDCAAGDLILICEAPPGTDAAGWSYGHVPRTGATGWYPPTFAH